jgi:hypothetical protein
MGILAFGGPLAWVSFLGALLLLPLLALAAHSRHLSALVWPLALLGLVAAGHTLANAVVYLLEWDFLRTYAEVRSFEPAGSKGELVATLLIPAWPYAAALFGLVLVLVYGVAACRPRWLIARLGPGRRPPAGPGRLARERARVARFDE